jgi:hypothetical protein
MKTSDQDQALRRLIKVCRGLTTASILQFRWIAVLDDYELQGAKGFPDFVRYIINKPPFFECITALIDAVKPKILEIYLLLLFSKLGVFNV